MNEYHRQVEEAVRATTFLSPTTYSWFGKPSWPLSPAVKRVLTPQTARNYLLFTLQRQLYTNFYCPGSATPVEGQVVIRSVTGGTPFVEALAAANLGGGYWDEGWQVRSVEGDRVIVRKEGLELWAHEEQCRVPKDEQIAPNLQLSLRFPKDFYSISPGFYMALGNEALTSGRSQELVRFYWNIASEGAVRLMRIATTLLNQADLPFTLKILNDPEQFMRCDAAVLYIRKSDYEAVASVLPDIYAAVDDHLRPAIPAFSKRLTTGLGLAEDPGTGQEGSFGEHRCRLLAEGMIRAYERGKRSLAERLHVVKECFAEAGISLDEPFLNPGSQDVYYVFQHEHRRAGSGQPGAGRPPGSPLHDATQETVCRGDPGGRPAPGHPDPTFLQTAASIGQQIVQEAIWHEDQCNWLGTGLRDYSPVKGISNPTTYRALRSDLYDGTSGIALFLAQLSTLTGDTTIRQTALGAIRQALCHVDSIPSSNRLGLYSGWIGIAFAAVRIGMLLGEEELLRQAVQLLARTRCEKPEQYEFDLIYGNTGAIVALLALRDILGDTSLLDFAVQLGDELLDTANRSERGCSWRSHAFPAQHNLTGLSHGAAGAAYALLELFHQTGNTTYRSVAEAAFGYERHWFDAAAANWPDFREDPFTGKQRKSKRSFPFATFWCHGAPGIALSRLRAYTILHDERYKAEALIALQTTQKSIETALYAGMDKFSLCHGLAGNADILLEGRRVLGQEWDSAALLTEKVATFGVNTYALPGRKWPCGIQGGTTPGLLLGLAGIGYFYLRMYCPSIPSILSCHPRFFAGLWR